jgi:hypothetical protein
MRPAGGLIPDFRCQNWDKRRGVADPPLFLAGSPDEAKRNPGMCDPVALIPGFRCASTG